MRACSSAGARLCRFVPMALVAAGAWGPPAVAGATAEIPPEVRQALERNGRAFAPIALTLEKQRSFPEPPPALSRKIAAGYTGFLQPYHSEYLSQDGLCYTQYNLWVKTRTIIPGTDKMKEEVRSKLMELSCNGKTVRRGCPEMEPPMLSIVPFEKVATDGELQALRWYNEDDYLAMIGIAVPVTMKELSEGPRSELLRLLEGDGRVTGARTERSAGGTDQFVVELLSGQKKHRFWLDPSYGHAVRRHEVWAASGALAVDIENSDFVKLKDPELWLPRHSRAEWHTWPTVAGQECSRETAVVVDIRATRLERARVPVEKFALNYDKPGSSISDATLPGAEKEKDGRINYSMPADRANLEEVIRAARERSAFEPSRRPLVAWIIVGSIVLGAAAGAIVVIRRRRSRPTTP
jgi:hypothetical protein